jgi:hypothetical protein
MKIKMLTLIFAFIFSGVLYSQNFYVIKTEGKVYVDGKLLKTGDKMTQEMKITFTSVNNKLYLLSPEKGNFLIVPGKNSDSHVPGWIVVLKNALPESRFYKTASRGVENAQVFNDIYDLMGFFRDRVTYIQDTRFEINGDKISLDEKNSFLFRSVSNTEKSVPPGYKTGPGFFTLTGTDTTDLAENQVELLYVQSGKKTVVGNFAFYTKSRAAVKAELSQFFQHMDVNITNPSQVYYEQVLPYLSKSYGNTNQDVIREIIRNDLGIALQLAE